MSEDKNKSKDIESQEEREKEEKERSDKQNELVEMANIDSEELEKAVQRVKDNFETRDKK